MRKLFILSIFVSSVMYAQDISPTKNPETIKKFAQHYEESKKQKFLQRLEKCYNRQELPKKHLPIFRLSQRVQFNTVGYNEVTEALSITSVSSFEFQYLRYQSTYGLAKLFVETPYTMSTIQKSNTFGFGLFTTSFGVGVGWGCDFYDNRKITNNVQYGSVITGNANVIYAASPFQREAPYFSQKTAFEIETRFEHYFTNFFSIHVGLVVGIGGYFFHEVVTEPELTEISSTSLMHYGAFSLGIAF